jgi:uncharacterized phage protein gp47/JayE
VKTPAEWSDQLVKALNTIDPNISTDVGDPIRKILDAAASVASGIDINAQVNMSFFDIDSKSGADLDALASWLGFGRQSGLKATGQVRFYLDTPATVEVDIPSDFQITDGSLIYSTNDAAIIPVAQYEVFVNATCTTPGVQGNANAYSINQIASNFYIKDLKVENRYNFTGGYDVETDAELRARIRATFLRNVAGTEDAYMGTAMNVVGNSRVNVIGPIERWEEQLEVVNLPQSLGGGIGFQSMIPCSKFTWPRQTYLVKEPGTAKEHAYVEGKDYFVDTSYGSQPVVKLYKSSADLNLDNMYGADLDALGTKIGLGRFSGSSATGTVSFGFDVAQKSNYVLKAGTRLQDSSGNVYSTKSDATIYSGAIASAAVPVESEDLAPRSVASGAMLTLPDRSGFKCEVSTPISGGQEIWTDAVYRAKLADAFNASVNFNVGDFLFFKHEYCPIESRNDPAANPPLVNKVDVFVDGVESYDMTECAQVSSKTIDNVAGSIWNMNDYYYEDGTHPQNGTKMQVLGFSPVLTIPESLNISGAMYVMGTNYRLLKQQNLNAGTQREIDAIAWVPGSSVPSGSSVMNFSYSYNRTVAITDALLDANRQISTDVISRQAISVGLDIRLVIQNVLGASNDAVLLQVQSILKEWASTLTYGSWIQFSDIEAAVRNSTSSFIDACRVAAPADASKIVSFGTNAGNAIGSGIGITEKYRHYLASSYDKDFRLWDSMIPYINSVDIVREGANSYNS